MTTICPQHQLTTKFHTADKPVGERKFNGERSWCYPAGPAGTWPGPECGSGVRCAGTSSRDEHPGVRRFQHRKHRADQRRRRRHYRRAYPRYQQNFCAVHGRWLRTGAPAELQSPGAKVNSSLIERSRPCRSGSSSDILLTALAPPRSEPSVASEPALGVRNFSRYLQCVEQRLRKNRRYLSGLCRIRATVTAGQDHTGHR
jgi:hypothetical protein